MMRCTFLLLLLLSAAGCAANANRKPAFYTLDVSYENEECNVDVEGQPAAAEQLLERLQQLPNKSADIHIRAKKPDIPYRCVGGAIYSAQMAGFIRIGFATSGADR